MPLDALLVLLAGIVFLVLYGIEKLDNGYDIVFKYLWLFAGITLVIASFFSNSLLTSALINPTNNTITWIYAPDNTTASIGAGVGVIWFILIILMAWRLIRIFSTKKVK